MDYSKVFIDLGYAFESRMGHDLFNPVHLRFTVTLDHDADDELIKKAWDRTKRVYPIIESVIGLDHGDPNLYLGQEARKKYMFDHIYLVRPDSGVNDPVKTKIPVIPGTDIVGKRLISISYYGKKVSISAYHTIVDGGGLNKIFGTFLYSYLALYTGNEDKEPNVDLEENRELEEYYTPVSPPYVYSMEYTPVPLYTLPLGCRGFNDKDMVNDEENVFSGDINISAPDFMKFCKENGANPSSMMCTLLAKAAYELNPSEKNDMVFGLTLSVRKIFGLDKTIANAVGTAIAYTTRDDIENKSIAEVSQKIRKDLDVQRSRDYYISHCRTFQTYKHVPNCVPRTVTYIGRVDIGSNNSHIVDFSMETNGDSNLYLMQLNDKFILTLQYGMATEKYLNEFNKIFTELGINSEIAHPAHHVDKDSDKAIL